MTDVVIAGIAQSPVGEHWDQTLRSMAVKVMVDAIKDAGGLRPQALFVANIFGGNLSHQAHLGALLTDFANLQQADEDDAGKIGGIEATTIEAGGASGGAALRQAYIAVESGFVDAALVVGVEKYTDMVGSQVQGVEGTLTDSDFEGFQGMTPQAQAAILTRRYMQEYDVPADGLAGFSITAHANGAGNPNAMFRRQITLDIYRNAQVISDPLNVFDMAPDADGAAAVLLTRRELLPENLPHALVRIAGSASVSDTLGLHNRRDLMRFGAAEASVKEVLGKVKLALEQVDLFEYHDTYSIYAALTLEAAGFAPVGQGWKMASNDAISLTGQIPCATMGGSKARGEAGGATGVYQAVEATLQLRGQAGKNQIEAAGLAMIQSLGGPAATAVTHILERVI